MRPYIKWRVEGTEGMAEGTIGWPEYPPCAEHDHVYEYGGKRRLDDAALERSLVSRRVSGADGGADGCDRERARTGNQRKRKPCDDGDDGSGI